MSFQHTFGHATSARLSLDVEGRAPRLYLLIDEVRAAEVLTDTLDLEGAITGIEWITPPVWLNEETAFEVAEDLLDLSPEATLPVYQPPATRAAVLRSLTLGVAR